jgi:hypothetical protein
MLETCTFGVGALRSACGGASKPFSGLLVCARANSVLRETIWNRAGGGLTRRLHLDNGLSRDRREDWTGNGDSSELQTVTNCYLQIIELDFEGIHRMDGWVGLASCKHPGRHVKRALWIVDPA